MFVPFGISHLENQMCSLLLLKRLSVIMSPQAAVLSKTLELPQAEL